MFYYLYLFKIIQVDAFICEYKFEDNCTWKVGNGREIRLWDDTWVDNRTLKDNTTLKDNFPRLFSISLNKKSSLFQGGVNGHGRLSGEEICSNGKRFNNNR